VRARSRANRPCGSVALTVVRPQAWHSDCQDLRYSSMLQKRRAEHTRTGSTGFPVPDWGRPKLVLMKEGRPPGARRPDGGRAPGGASARGRLRSKGCMGRVWGGEPNLALTRQWVRFCAALRRGSARKWKSVTLICISMALDGNMVPSHIADCLDAVVRSVISQRIRSKARRPAKLLR
jgi:hypothetical protein